MLRALQIAAVGVGWVLAAPATAELWVQFEDQTAGRIVSAPDVGADDLQEKDYAWGDVDQDGDVDLVVARKQPRTLGGKFANVLFLNEGGVLTDRTADFASDSDVEGDSGFLTPTHDRDIQIADLDGDGWLDVVTAVSLGFGDPKHIGHPRVYINQGCSGVCDGTKDWLGFRYEDRRIPQLLTWTGNDGINPCFTSVAVGDVTGDGFADLYFTDHDIGSCGAESSDFNDRLLINVGASDPGVFIDGTDGRFIGLVQEILVPFPISDFGTSSAIVDLDGDSFNDILKQNFLKSIFTSAAYNDPAGRGFFQALDLLDYFSSSWASVGELNNDGQIDIVLTWDGPDHYLINQGPGIDDLPEWADMVFSFANDGPGGPAGDDGFGANSLVADLDADGWNDVLIADFDETIQGCTRRMHIYRNLGGTPGDNVILEEQTSGFGCEVFAGNPPTCTVAGIASNELEGVHDVAVFDLDDDGLNDMIVGRCDGTRVYLNVPVPQVGSIPDGGHVAGAPLVLEAEERGDVTLSWDASCSSQADDYEIYEGALGQWYSHARRLCSTGGATSETLTPTAGDRYYLVVPTEGTVEGSYGRDSAGIERPVGVHVCAPRVAASCTP